MQKHASDLKKIYNTVFTPLPTEMDAEIYIDSQPVFLAYAEDFPKLHYHDKYEIGICKEGDGLFITEGEFCSVSKGDFVFISPGKRHYSHSLNENALCKFQFVYINKSLLDLTTIPYEQYHDNEQYIPPVVRTKDHPSSSLLLGEIINICMSDNPCKQSVALRLALFIIEAKEHFCFSQKHSVKPVIIKNPQPGAAKIAEFLSLHYTESHTAKELSVICHLSESQLRRQFLNVYGIPPIAYKNRLRCAIAAELLCRTNLSVSEISMQTGYDCTSSFYRQFQKIYGISPSGYREAKTNK